MSTIDEDDGDEVTEFFSTLKKLGFGIPVVAALSATIAATFGESSSEDRTISRCLDRSTASALFAAAGNENIAIDESRIYVSLPEFNAGGFHIDVCPKIAT